MEVAWCKKAIHEYDTNKRMYPFRLTIRVMPDDYGEFLTTER